MSDILTLDNFLPIILSIVFIAIYYFVRWAMHKRFAGNTDKSLITQIVLFSIITVGVISVILSIPFDEGGGTRENIITILGYIISGIIALSSATFIGNALAGVMLRAIRNFKAGDYIEVRDYKGRVSERGLFHTEIQMENSDLTTIPNLFLVTNPVSVTRSSGTFVSATISLGYDVPRQKIEEALLSAAEKSNLRDAFVIIESLGDFSVVYRVQGKLHRNNLLIASRSRLNAMVLDAMRDARIEIVSPTFMNQRLIGDMPPFIPEEWKGKQEPGFATQIDKMIFDKALEAEHLENKKDKLSYIKAKCEEYKEALKTVSEEDREKTQKLLDRYEKIRASYEEKIVEKAEELKKTEV